MALVIDTTVLPDAPTWFERSLTAEIVGGFFQVTGNNARVILLYGRYGGGQQTEDNVLAPGSYNVGRPTDGKPLTGIRAQNATAGLPSNLAGYFWDASSPALSFVGEVAAAGASVVGVPVGAIVAWGSAVAPSNYLLCDGSAVSRTTYALLFAAIGTTYGPGDGATTFNVPDLRGRVPVGLGTNASVNALAGSDGVAVANRRPQHRHTPHSHTSVARDGAGAGNMFRQGNNVAVNHPTTSVDGGSGVATDALDSPAWLVVNYIIAAGV